MRFRSVAALLVLLVLSVIAVMAPAASLGDPASDLAAAQGEEAVAKSKMTDAEQAVSQAERALAPIAERADTADQEAEAALAEVGEVKKELVTERRAAAKEVETAEASYDDEKSSHDRTSGIGIAIAIVAVLLAIAAFIFSKVRKWPLSKQLTQILGGALGVVFIGGLVLALVPSSPSSPEFSAETQELAKAAEGDPAEPPSPELKEAEEAAAPLVAAAEPLDSEREKAEGAVESAQGKVQYDESVLASAERDSNVAQNEIDRIKAAEERKAARIEAIEAKETAFKEEATTIDYNQLIKNPEAYTGEKVVYTGQILQIQEEAGFGFMLLSVTDEGYGFWTDNIWVDFFQPIGAAEEDVITVYGKLTGSEEYETQIGGSTYVPKMNAKYVEE